MINKNQMNEFLCKLDKACNFQGKGAGSTWKCNGDIDDEKSFTQTILAKMKLSKEEIKDVLKNCKKYGGYCDCEILLNAAEELLEIAK